MNIKITDKNGITLKTKDKFVAEDIAVGIDESLLGGEGATITLKPTAIPNDGSFVENIYLNTSLSITEVVDILKSITLTLETAEYTFFANDESAGLGILVENGFYEIAYFNEGSPVIVFVYNNGSTEIAELGFSGWNPAFTNPISVNKTGLSYETGLELGLPVGSQNEQLKELMSITPIGEPVILEGEYDGSSLVVDNISPIEVNAPIPTSGTLNSININSNLSIEETIAIIDNLKMAEADLGTFVMGMYWVFSSNDKYQSQNSSGQLVVNGYILEITKNIFTDSTQNRYAIKYYYGDDNYEILFNYNWDTSLANGWLIANKLVFGEPLTLVSSMQNNNGESLAVGTDNKNLTDIFYIKKEEPFSINIEKLINNKKIPLNIKFKYVLPKVIKSGSWQGTAVPNSGTLSEVYFNTSMSVEEVVNLIEQLTFEKLSPSEDTLYNFILSDITQSGGSIAYMVSKDPNNNAYKIFNYINSKEFFSSDNGWNLESFTDTNKISFNEPINVATSFMGAYAVGAENDKISSLFSTTPFVQAGGEEVKLEGEYDGSTLVIEDISNGYAEGGKLAFPNTGYVEHMYVNTEMTQSEVKDTLGKITGWIDTSENQDGSSFVYAVLYNPTFALFIMKMGSDYMMQALLTELGLEGIIYDDTQGGWLSDGIEFVETYLEKWEVGEVFSDVEGIPIGTDNDKLVDLFYTLPKANTINVKSLINSKKIPLEIEVKGGGEANGLPLVVEELPNTAEEGAIYKTDRKFTDMYIVYGTSNQLLLSDIYEVLGCEEVDTKPTSNINSSNLAGNQFYLYYVKDENDIFAYGDMGSGAMWISASLLLEQAGISGSTFKGEVNATNLTSEAGYYAYFINDKKYLYSNNEFEEINDISSWLSKFYSNEYIPKLNLNIHSSTINDKQFLNKNIDYIKINLTELGPYSTIYDNAFNDCKAKTIYLIGSGAVQIYNNVNFGVFHHCENLTKLVLDFPSFENLSYGNTFTNTPIESGSGYIYVPDSLVDTVKGLQGWSTYASQIKPLSEYVED